MPWLQIQIAAQRQSADAIEDALLAAGAVSVTMQDNADQPILEPALGETPLWNHVKITGLFDAEVDTDEAVVITTAVFGDSLPSYRWELLEDKDWERAWMDNFHPMRFGNRLWICPSWKSPPEPDAANLMLDPGLAFGTGTHPTTALCLEWLDSLDLTGKTVVDYGCGSGILGIAALLLGAVDVIAVDNDPQALIATIDNAKRNNISMSSIHSYLPDQVPENTTADVVVANILAGPLADLAPIMNKMCNPEGQLALSGIINTQIETLATHYNPFFEMHTPVLKQEWARLSGRKR
jgi:ribosomal protein L11 methyltransferase